MLLTVDVGNTSITLGLYDRADLKQIWRLETVHTKTSDEYGLLVGQLLAQIELKPSIISGVIIASVVPILTRTITTMAERLTQHPPLVVGPGLKTGMPILYDPPKDVGADRIVNAVAAFERFKSACIVVDFGSATTFDSITTKGAYAGGAIAPGIAISMEALFSRTAKLPRVDLDRPDRVVGKSTATSIQSGAYYGYVGLVDGLVIRMKAEMTRSGAAQGGIRVIGTGGLAPVIAQDAKTIETVDDGLTLEGLRLLYTLNTQ